MRQQVIVAALGLWLMIAPAALGFGDPARSLGRIAGPIIASSACIAAFDIGRPLRWLALAVAVLFTAISLVPPFVSTASACSAIVMIVMLVPLTFTTPAARGPCGIGTRATDDMSPVPPGWKYNPSTWGQRLPLVGVALIGAAIASYLAAFQLGWVSDVWDPFFGRGTRVILTSGVSRILPIPDAALGAIGYFADALTGIIGGRSRWRTLPWLVIVFGIAVGPLGAVSVLLVILQPVVFGAWCTLCLASAVISVLMIGPAMDEVLASLQHVGRTMRSGESLWGALAGRTRAARPMRSRVSQRSQADAVP